jgi:amino acid transporter
MGAHLQILTCMCVHACATVCVCVCVCGCRYDALIEFSVIKSCLTSILYMYSYVWYRVKRPDMERPFNLIPCGVVGGVMMAAPVLAMAFVTLYYAAISGDEVLGLKDAKIFGALIFVSAGVLVNLIYLAYLRWVRGASGSYSLDGNGGMLTAVENEALLIPDKTTAPGTDESYGSF